MKRVFLLLPFVVATVLLLAQQPNLLRNSQYLGFEGHKVALSNSSTMVIWNDTSSGNSDILAQKISSLGNILWPSARALVSKPYDQRICATATSSDGNILLAYSEYSFSDGSMSYWVQKISQAGQPLWPNGGYQILNGQSYHDEVQLVANSIGGAYALWRDEYPSIGVYGANLDAFGTNLWTSDPIFSNNGLYSIQALNDGSGGFILNSGIYTSGVGLSNHVIRFDSAGDIVGSNPLLPPNAIVPNSFRMLKDSQGNYVLFRSQDNSLTLQKMDINGNILFPSLINHPLPNWVYINDESFEICPDGALAYAFQYYGSDSVNHILVNYLDSSGQAIWANPVDFVAEECNSLAFEAANGFWLSWINSSGYWPNDQVFTTKVNLDGSLAFTPLAISGDGSDKLFPVISAYENKAVVCWNDQSGMLNGIKTQVITNTGSIMQEPEGTAVYNVLNGSTELIEILDISNRFLHLYYDTRLNWNNKLYYQLTDTNASPLLETNGRALNPTSSDPEKFLDCCISPWNTVWLFYAVYSEDNYTLYLQELNADGSVNYAGFGLAVATGSFNLEGCKLSIMNGDVLVIWPALDLGSTYSSIHGQKYSNGIPQWQAGGKVLAPANGNFLIPKALHSDYLIYYKENYTNSRVTLQAQRLDANGDPFTGWPVDGLQVFAENSLYQMYMHSGLVNNSLVVVAMHYGDAGMQTSAQRINSIAVPLWGPNGVTLSELSSYSIDQIMDAIYDQGLTYLSWNGDSNVLKLNRIDLDGTKPWSEYGIEISSVPGWNMNCALIKYPNGIYSVFHCSLTNDSGVQLYRTDIADNGSLLHPEPLVLATNRTGFWAVKAVANQYESQVSWNENYYYELRDKGEAVCLSSLWTLKVNAPVSSDDQMVTPVVYKLGNHPNPFVGSTSIDFAIKEASNVKVDVYNLKGQLVRSLVNESKAQGEYSLNWDSRDNNGLPVAAGVYLYKIQAGKFSSSKKMVLLK